MGLDPGGDSLVVASPPGIDIEWLSESEGVYGMDDFSAPPSPTGVLFRRPLPLPDFEKACYYAPFQKHAIDPTLDLWPEAYNQCHPLPLTDLRQAKQGGIFLLLKLVSGEYLAVLPLVTPRSMAWLRGDGSSLLLEAGHWGTDGWQGELPLLAWARSANPYEACEKAWRRALSHPLLKNRARMRAEKQYPEQRTVCT